MVVLDIGYNRLCYTVHYRMAVKWGATMSEVYKIVQKKNKNAVYACGFYSLESANAWLAQYNPKMWMEKDVLATDLEIVAERRGKP